MGLTARFLTESAAEGDSLIDLGCGAGDTLAYLAAESPIRNFTALDISANLLDRTRDRVTCETLLGSVLDSAIADRLAGRFNFAVLAAVLHHLVGRTRAESRRNAVSAVRNALAMLVEDGKLIIHEPTLDAHLAMDALFHVKRALGRLSGNRRVPVLGYWGNLGAPVVSYYSEGELRAIVSEAGGSIVREWRDPDELPSGVLGAVMRRLDRSDVTLVVGSG